MAKNNLNWKRVYERSAARIFHYFCYKVGDTSLAEDLTAITFEKAWMNRANFDKTHGEVGAWIFGIARNVAADHFRGRKDEIPLDDAMASNNTGSCEEQVQAKLDFQCLMQIIGQHEERDRELIAMKYGAELTNREIARLTGLSESNVGTILYRIVKKIRNEWEKNNA